MELIQYEIALNDYILEANEIIAHLRTIPYPEFKCIEIDCNAIESKWPKWQNRLIMSGVTVDSRVLYYITIKSNHSPARIKEIVKKRKAYKRNSKKYIALPKVNDSIDSKVLYVGKCNSNFNSRFIHHMGKGSRKTYSLQLVDWAAEMDLQLCLYYAIVEIPNDKIHYLELVETILHKKLSPILGRSGH